MEAPGLGRARRDECLALTDLERLARRMARLEWLVKHRLDRLRLVILREEGIRSILGSTRSTSLEGLE